MSAAAPASASASPDRDAENRRRSGGPKARAGAAQITGEVVHEPVHRAVKDALPALTSCYDDGIKKNAQLKGRVIFSFSIDAAGSAKDVKPDGDMPDKSVIECAQKAIAGAKFPKPKAGMVTVRYPILFSPGETIAGKPAAEAAQADLQKALADAGATEVDAKPKEGAAGAVTITGRSGAGPFTVTFVPKSAGPNVLDSKEIERLATTGIVYTDDAFVLALELTPFTEADKLFKAVVKER